MLQLCKQLYFARLNWQLENSGNQTECRPKFHEKRVIAVITKINETPNCHMKYSDLLIDKSQPVISIHPNNSTQSSSSTEAEILRNVDPGQENLKLTKVKPVKDGGILISCGSEMRS
ncbi:hypothetical protein JTB14_019260 [Gonioctena quinquepunctata]|nr:hypothetical protein JTB14_019260 [Gonioctena quinquepunctata]